MASSSPMETVRTGRVGRPANVRHQVETLLARTLTDKLRASPLIAEAVTRNHILAHSRLLADSLWHHLHAAGFRIIPARFASELAILTGELPKADDPALPKPAANLDRRVGVSGPHSPR